ncbi:hypothetical protein BJX99DRAFT_47597 [Aspergillus californicus]
MDPFSSLSVATAVVQFVQFGGKLLNTYFDVRSNVNGQPVEVVGLAASATDLSCLASTAHEKVEGLASSYPRHAASSLRLKEEVGSVESAIQSAMAKLTANPKKYLPHSVARAVVTIKAVSTADEWRQWNKQLDRIRDQVMMNVLMCIWDETRKLDARAGHIIQAMERIEKAIETFSNSSERETSRTESQTVMYEAIWESTGLPDTTPKTVGNGSQSITETTRAQIGGEPSFTDAILRSLEYDAIKYRSSSIGSAFPDTFQWIFSDERHNFRKWLTSQDKTIFWITGIPASGKSTLINFITEHRELNELLKAWAEPHDFYLAKFYFWNPGSRIQKSRVGLLRSLLFQLLRGRQDLITTVASRRRLYFSITEGRGYSPQWKWEELCECLASLASRLYAEDSRLVLFIDGLDEYEGFVQDNPESVRSTDEIVNFLMGLNENYGAKLCVSSRPLNYFRDKFKDCQSLAMQNLTQVDIDHYIDARLGRSEAIQEMQILDKDAVQNLISDLKSKAQGVFLWVVLVVEQLLLTCLDKPHIGALRSVFDSLPDDLIKLYDAIQQQIGREKQVEASKMYQILMEWKETFSEPVEATYLWLAALHDVKQPQYPPSEKEKHIAKLTKRLVDGNTRGILQVSTPGLGYRSTVDFLHKTAHEWIQQSDNWRRIVGLGPLDYVASLALLAVQVSRVRSLSIPKAENFKAEIPKYLDRLFYMADRVPNNQSARNQLVSIIDKLELRHLTPDPSFPFSPHILETLNRKADPDALTWAAAWPCLAYLESKLDSSRTEFAVSSKASRPSFFSRNNPPTNISLLEAAIFGYTRNKNSLWHITRRLQTIRVLLQRGARIEKYIVKALKRPQGLNDVGRRYHKLLMELAKDRDILANFDTKVAAMFPDIDVAKPGDDSDFVGS